MGGSSVYLEDVEAPLTYQLNLTASTYTNTTSMLYFRIKGGNATWEKSGRAPSVGLDGTTRQLGNSGPLLVRAEEITIVLLVLALWVTAILLFFHRWGKIRMLEPYQPEYKPLNHTATCPMAPPPPTPLPPRRNILPRKSSSLCFTPSMLRGPVGEGSPGPDSSDEIPVSSPCRQSNPRLDLISQGHRCSASKLQDHRYLTDRGGTVTPDYISTVPLRCRDLCRKARSAENLRTYRVLKGPCEETFNPHGRLLLTLGSWGHRSRRDISPHRYHHPRLRVRRLSQSLENCRMGRPPPGVTERRGYSLDSYSISSLRPSPTANGASSPCGEIAGPSTSGLLSTSTALPTDVLGHSPTRHYDGAVGGISASGCSGSGGGGGSGGPSSGSGSAGRAGTIVRQDTVDETLLPVPYETLMEEENEQEHEDDWLSLRPSRYLHNLHNCSFDRYRSFYKDLSESNEEEEEEEEDEEEEEEEEEDPEESTIQPPEENLDSCPSNSADAREAPADV